MNITSATGGRNEVAATEATILPGGTGMATVGIRKHRPNQAEKVAEAARRKVEETRSQAARAKGLGSSILNTVG